VNRVSTPTTQIAPGEPAFVRRRPDGVEYTRIETIFMDLPSSLTTLLWSTPSEDDRLVAAFKGRTIRAIDRALRHEANTDRDRHEISAIRHELAQLALYEANRASSPHRERRISVTHVFPQLFDEPALRRSLGRSSGRSASASVSGICTLTRFAMAAARSCCGARVEICEPCRRIFATRTSRPLRGTRD
jgi:hypothetical protein